MKYLEENEVIYKKPTINGNPLYVSKRNRETVSSPIDQIPVINSSNNSVLTPPPPPPGPPRQSLQNKQRY